MRKIILVRSLLELEYELILSKDLIGPNHLFNRSFTQVRAMLSLFFHYVDLEYELILSNDLIEPKNAQSHL